MVVIIAWRPVGRPFDDDLIRLKYVGGIGFDPFFTDTVGLGRVFGFEPVEDFAGSLVDHIVVVFGGIASDFLEAVAGYIGGGANVSDANFNAPKTGLSASLMRPIPMKKTASSR